MAGQLSATVDAMSFRTTFQYDNAGNRTSVEDANSKLTTTMYFSNRNQVQATVDAMGFRTSYVYDLQGRLQSTQDANGHFVTNVYDSMGRLQFVKNALGENARQYGYDLAGRMVTYADAADRVRTLKALVAVVPPGPRERRSAVVPLDTSDWLVCHLDLHEKGVTRAHTHMRSPTATADPPSTTA